MNPLSDLGDYLNKESSRWLLWTPLGIALYFALQFKASLVWLIASPLWPPLR